MTVADAALYCAKDEGRDRIRAADANMTRVLRGSHAAAANHPAVQ